MFEKVGIPILGIVEKHVVPRLSEVRPRKPHLRARRGCKDEQGLRHRASRPAAARRIDPAACRFGQATVVSDPEGKLAEIYRRIARRCAVKIAESQRDMTSKFPNIVVQNT